MPTARTTCQFLLILFVFVQTSCFSFSQPSRRLIEEWIIKLRVRNDDNDKGLRAVSQALRGKDSMYVNTALRDLEVAEPGNHHYKARVFLLKAEQVYEFYFPYRGSSAKQYFDEALNEAYKTSDESFIGSVCRQYAATMYSYQKIELSVTYFLTADEMYSRARVEPENLSGLWAQLGEILFHTREYEKSIHYLRKALDNWNDSSVVSQIGGKSGKTGRDYRMQFWNAMGQDYQKLGQLDSALANYERSMQLADRLRNNVWRAINSGFMGQVFFLRKEYEKAKPLLWYDYSVNETIEKNIAAYSLYWLAKINLVQGKKDSALLQVRKALNLLRQSNSFLLQRAVYLDHVYYTTADAFRAKGDADSFYHYFQLYSALHDSLERVAVLSSSEIARMRIENEKNYQSIQSLERKKKAEVLTRNFILIAMVLVAIILILILNRQRQRSVHKRELTLREKAAAEAEVALAMEQLHTFKQSIIEKTTLIEKLEEQIHRKETAAEQLEIANELSRQTILTEEDWDKFKKLFEKIYPGFFVKLREKATDITLAEQRMAALTRLHLTTKQIASMLGISVDSVHKTRQRLRQRLQLGSDTNLEETIAYL